MDCQAGHGRQLPVLDVGLHGWGRGWTAGDLGAGVCGWSRMGQWAEHGHCLSSLPIGGLSWAIVFPELARPGLGVWRGPDPRVGPGWGVTWLSSSGWPRRCWQQAPGSPAGLTQAVRPDCHRVTPGPALLGSLAAESGSSMRSCSARGARSPEQRRFPGVARPCPSSPVGFLS